MSYSGARHRWRDATGRSEYLYRLDVGHLINLVHLLRRKPIIFIHRQLRDAIEFDAYAMDRDWYCGSDPELDQLYDLQFGLHDRQPIDNLAEVRLAYLTGSPFYDELVWLIGTKIAEQEATETAAAIAEATTP